MPSSLIIVLSFPNIELIHRSFCAPMNQYLQRIDRPFETRLKHLHLILRHLLQHVICGILTRCRTTDSDFQPDELSSSQRVNHGFHAVVASMASRLFDAKASWLQVQIVMDENEIVGGELELAEKALQRRAGEVHEVERGGQLDQL